MSNVRLKIWSFNSAKTHAKEICDEVNKFLSDPNIIVEPADIQVLPDDFTVVNVVYKLNKKVSK